MQDKLLFALSLCRKAGALVTGYDAVMECVNDGRAQLALCAADAAERTARHTQDACAGRVEFCRMALTVQQLSRITKKPTAVFAVTDRELAHFCRTCMPGQTAAEKEERP